MVEEDIGLVHLVLAITSIPNPIKASLHLLLYCNREDTQVLLELVLRVTQAMVRILVFIPWNFLRINVAFADPDPHRPTDHLPLALLQDLC